MTFGNYRTVDAIVVLAGEHKTKRPRSHRAASLYYDLLHQGRATLPIIATGGHNGHETRPPGNEQSALIKEFLASTYAIDPREITAETESRDTLANLVYTAPILDDMGADAIALVTEEYHMHRALALGKRVFGTRQEIVPVPAHSEVGGIGITIRERIIERMTRQAIRKIPADDFGAFAEYIGRKHPYHGDEPRKDLYWALTKLR